MYKLNVYFRKKLIAKHWYPEEQKNECYAAAFALHNHPHFGYRTEVEHQPKTRIIYETDKQ